ncbi:MAG TPA: hypothetical protein VGO37_06315 [Steroidobacteraceae bacterium]|jgi:hypothetical protein|nr:hypothetical protein [Steroidobacteraceae bacterium]
MRCIAVATLVALAWAGAIGKGVPPPPQLGAAQIVAKNVEARGGLEAWRKIQTMVWVGHMESMNAPQPSMPFVLQQKRPNKTRFELMTMNQRSVRVFDGTHGWKMRPERGGSSDVQVFTPQELKFARDAQVIDGPLIDYAAKGNTVTLLGAEKIEGRNAYRVDVHLASGEHQTLWIDAATFLEVRLDRMSFSSSGMPGMATVFYRNYQTVEGLQIPSMLEIGVGSGKKPDRMFIEKISLNEMLEDRTFDRPGMPRRRTARQPGSAAALSATGRPPAPRSSVPAKTQAESEE